MTFDNFQLDIGESLNLQNVKLGDWVVDNRYAYSVVSGLETGLPVIKIVQRELKSPSNVIEYPFRVSGVTVEDVKIALDATGRVFIVVQVRLQSHLPRSVAVFELESGGFRFRGEIRRTANPIRLRNFYFDAKGNPHVEFLEFRDSWWVLGRASFESEAGWSVSYFGANNFPLISTLQPDKQILTYEVNRPIVGNLYTAIQACHGRERLATGNFAESYYSTIGDGSCGLFDKVPGWEDWIFTSHDSYTQRVKKDLTDYSYLEWTNNEWVHGLAWRKGKLWTTDYFSRGATDEDIVGIEIDPDDWSYTKHVINFGEDVHSLWVAAVGEHLYFSGYGWRWLAKWNPDTDELQKIHFSETNLWWNEWISCSEVTMSTANYLSPPRSYLLDNEIRCLTHIYSPYNALNWTYLIDFRHEDPIDYRILKVEGVDRAGGECEYLFVRFPHAYIVMGHVLFKVDLIEWKIVQSVYLGDYYQANDYSFPYMTTDGHYLYLSCPSVNKIVVFTFDLHKVAEVSFDRTPYFMLIREPEIWIHWAGSPTTFSCGRIGWVSEPTPKVGILPNTELRLKKDLDEDSGVSDVRLKPAHSFEYSEVDFKNFGKNISDDRDYLYALRETGDAYVFQFDKVSGTGKFVEIPSSEVLPPPRDIVSDGDYAYVVSDHPATGVGNKLIVHRIDVGDFWATGRELWREREFDTGPIRPSSLAIAGDNLYVAAYESDLTARRPLFLFRVRRRYRDGQLTAPEVERAGDMYRIHLKEGWQVISLPIYPANPDRWDMLGPHIWIWDWDVVQQKWVLNPSTLSPGKAYFVYVPPGREKTIELSGTEYSTDWATIESNLQPGWNSVGVGTQDIEIGDYYHRVMAWGTSQGGWFDLQKDEKMQPGFGYFILKDGGVGLFEPGEEVDSYRPYLVADGNELFIAGTRSDCHYLIKLTTSDPGHPSKVVHWSTDKGHIFAKPVLTPDYVYVFDTYHITRFDRNDLGRSMQLGLSFKIGAIAWNSHSRSLFIKPESSSAVAQVSESFGSWRWLSLRDIDSNVEGPMFYDRCTSQLFLLQANPPGDYSHLWAFRMRPEFEAHHEMDDDRMIIEDSPPIPIRVGEEVLNIGLSRVGYFKKVLSQSFGLALTRVNEVIKSLMSSVSAALSFKGWDWLPLSDYLGSIQVLPKFNVRKGLSAALDTTIGRISQVQTKLRDALSFATQMFSYDWIGLLESMGASVTRKCSFSLVRSLSITLSESVKKEFLKALNWLTYGGHPTYPIVLPIAGGHNYTFRKGWNYFANLEIDSVNKLISKGMVVYRYDSKAGWCLVPPYESFSCDKAGYFVYSPETQAVDLTGDACSAYTWQELKDSLVKGSWNLVGIYSDMEVEDADNLILKYDEAEDEWYPVVEGETLRKGHAYWILEGTPGASRFTISDRFNAWDWLAVSESFPVAELLVKHFRGRLTEILSIGVLRKSLVELTRTLSLTFGTIREALVSKPLTASLSAFESFINRVTKRLFITSTYKVLGSDTYPEVTDYTIHLKHGTNFVSIMRDIGDISPAKLFGEPLFCYAWNAKEQYWYVPSRLECGKGYYVSIPNDRDVTLPEGSVCPTPTWEEMLLSLEDGWNLIGVGDGSLEVKELESCAVYAYDYDAGKYFPLTKGTEMKRGHAYWVCKGMPEKETRALKFSLSFRHWDWLGLSSRVPTVESLSKHVSRPLPTEAIGFADSWYRVFIKRPAELLQLSVTRFFDVLHRVELSLTCRVRWKIKIYNLLAGVKVLRRLRRIRLK